MSEGGYEWNGIVSANKRAEIKYRNVHCILKHYLGCPAPENSKRKLIPTKQKAVTLRSLMEEQYKDFFFESIPDVTFLPHSGLLVTSEFASVNHPNGKVTVFGVDGKPQTTFSPQDSSGDICLFGITSIVGNDDKVAICTGDGVSMWSIDGRMISNMTHCTVQNCCHVTAMQNGLLATTCLTELSGRCVTIWDPRVGSVISQFGPKPEIIEINPLKGKQRILIRKEDLRVPWFIASDSKLNVYIADCKAQLIKVYDTRNGSFVRRFDPAGVNTRCCTGSFQPQGLCIDEDDNVFVNDVMSRSVIMFDHHGEYVRQFPLQLKTETIWSLAMSECKSKGHDNGKRRNPLLSPSRKIAVSFSRRKPGAHIYDLSFCRHYAIGF